MKKKEGWEPFEIYQCRNCHRIATLKKIIYGFKDDKGETFGDEYWLCHVCRKKYIKEEDILTFGWTYNQLRERCDTYKSLWRKVVYGGQKIDLSGRTGIDIAQVQKEKSNNKKDKDIIE